VKSLGVGFVGAGWMGRTHAHALRTLEHIDPPEARLRLVSVAARRRESAERLAHDFGFERAAQAWEAVIADPEVDVVAVVAPNDLHERASVAALELGKPVLCEKPLARNAAEAESMLKAAIAGGAAHSCGFNYRFVPAVRLALHLIGSGQLGTTRQFRGCYLQDWAASPLVARGWRFARADDAAGAVGDYSHVVDLMRHLAGEPASLSARTFTFVEERPAPDDPSRQQPVASEDAYAAIVELAGGGVATLDCSRCATGWKGRQRIEVIGSDGSLWWDMEDLNRLHVCVQRDFEEGFGGFRDVLVTEREHPFLSCWWAPGHVLGWEHTFVHLWRDFFAAVTAGEPLPEEHPDFHDGHRAALVCDAILASARTKGAVTVPPHAVGVHERSP